VAGIRWLLENWGPAAIEDVVINSRNLSKPLQDDGRFLERLFRSSTGENPLPFRTDVVPPEVVQLLSRSARILELLPKAYLAGGTAL
jgi:hypothetical protein